MTFVLRVATSGLHFTSLYERNAIPRAEYTMQSLTKFNPKIQDFKRVLDLNCK